MRRSPQGRCAASRCIAQRRRRPCPVRREPGRRGQRLRAVRPHSAYSVPTTLGSGKTVAIVDAYDDPNAESRPGAPTAATSGCRPARPQRLLQEGQPERRDQSAPGGEHRLGAEEIARHRDGLGDLPELPHPAGRGEQPDDRQPRHRGQQRRHAWAPKFVSNSYGGSESRARRATTLVLQPPRRGDRRLAGDSGYGVEYPAASPYVTAVGGTALSHTSNARGWTESVWSTSSSEGAGSGCSAYEPKPSFQHDTGCSRRTIADVSAVADPATGVAVYDSYGSGGWTVFGGTSVASPIIGAMYALANSPAPSAYPNSYPYANPGALWDVTTGHTSTCSPAYLCTAEVGYDGPTGLGTPNGAAAFGPSATGHERLLDLGQPVLRVGHRRVGDVRDRLHRDHVGLGADRLAQRERPAERRLGLVLAVLGDRRSVITRTSATASERQPATQHHDHRDRIHGRADGDLHAKRSQGAAAAPQPRRSRIRASSPARAAGQRPPA